jgi:hypothetical protein
LYSVEGRGSIELLAFDRARFLQHKILVVDFLKKEVELEKYASKTS